MTDDGRWAIGFDDSPYRLQPDFARNRNDVYRIDPASGEKTLIAETLINAMGTSPDSRWFLFWQNQRVQAFELDSGEVVDLTSRYHPTQWTSDQGLPQNSVNDIVVETNGVTVTVNFGDKPHTLSDGSRLGPLLKRVSLRGTVGVISQG